MQDGRQRTEDVPPRRGLVGHYDPVEAEAVLGLGAAFAGSGLLLLLTVWLKIETAAGKRVGKALGLAQVALGAVLAAGAGVAMLS